VAALSFGIRVPIYSIVHPSKIKLQIFLGGYVIYNFFLRKFISNDFFLILRKVFFMQKIQIQREGE